VHNFKVFYDVKTATTPYDRQRVTFLATER